MAMINYDLMFMCQGLIDQTYMDMQLKSRAEWSKTMVAPAMLYIFSITVSVTSPTVEKGTLNLFFYPLYFPTWLQNTYTLGSFWWVFLLSWWCQAICNDIQSKFWYNIICGTSTTGYVTHYFFIIISAYYFVRPLKMGFIGGFFTNLIFTNICIQLTCIIINFISRLIFPPRKKREIKQPEEDKDKLIEN